MYFRCSGSTVVGGYLRNPSVIMLNSLCGLGEITGRNKNIPAWVTITRFFFFFFNYSSGQKFYFMANRPAVMKKNIILSGPADF